MKIAVSTSGEALDALIDPRFGRCQNFIFVDSDSLDFDVKSNVSMNTMGGAGIQAAQTIVDNGVEVVLTGNMGPNAFQTLNAAGIKIYTGVTGQVRTAIEKYKNGELPETTGPNVNSHAGMGGGSGQGRGGGKGKGKGNRKGMGIGSGQNRGKGKGQHGGIRKLD